MIDINTSRDVNSCELNNVNSCELNNESKSVSISSTNMEKLDSMLANPVLPSGDVLDFSHYRHIHFVGIGGSSMHGLAEFALTNGVVVTGSDLHDSPEVEALRKKGVAICIPHSYEFVHTHQPDAIVYTVAVPHDNPELSFARENNVPLIDRSVFLGLLMNKYEIGICVAGTHGKTSATSMISSVLFENGLDPAIHIGGILPLIGSNNHIGNGNCFVTEACEYHKSFLNLKADIGVVLNVEHDHVDYYSTFDEYKKAFCQFIDGIPKNGHVVICADNKPAIEVLKTANPLCHVVTYSLSDKTADWTVDNLSFDALGNGSFNAIQNNKQNTSNTDSKDSLRSQIHLSAPGKHNVSNALACIAVCSILGLSPDKCAKPLAGFFGAERRFQLKGSVNNITVIDDYAHHPTEIKATLDNLTRMKLSGNTWCVFQPHTYSRTKGLFELFKTSFTNVNHVVITDIYAAREQDPGDIHSTTLAQAVDSVSHNAVYISDFEDIVDYFVSNLHPGDLVLTLGAGSVTNIGPMLLEALEKRTSED